MMNAKPGRNEHRPDHGRSAPSTGVQNDSSTPDADRAAGDHRVPPDLDAGAGHNAGAGGKTPAHAEDSGTGADSDGDKDSGSDSDGGNDSGSNVDRGSHNTIGHRMRALIDRSGFPSQAAFARAIGVGVDTINYWVNNRRRPRRSSLADVARVLQVPPAAIFAYIERGVPLPDAQQNTPGQSGAGAGSAAGSHAPAATDHLSPRTAHTATDTASRTGADEAAHRDEAAVARGSAWDSDHLARVQSMRLARAGRHPERHIPLINRVAAGGPFDAHDLDEALNPEGIAGPVDYIDRYGIDDDPAFAFTVVGDSMAPTYQPGDICICSGSRPFRPGCDCFIRFTSERDDECTFKRVHVTDGTIGSGTGGGIPSSDSPMIDAESAMSESGLVVLVPLNPQHQATVVPREHIAQLWPVIELRRRVYPAG